MACAQAGERTGEGDDWASVVTRRGSGCVLAQLPLLEASWRLICGRTGCSPQVLIGARCVCPRGTSQPLIQPRLRVYRVGPAVGFGLYPRLTDYPRA